MSEEAAVEAKPPKPPGPKSPKLVMALLVLNLGASGFMTFRMLTASPAEAAHLKETKAPPPSEVSGPVVALDPFVVNLDEVGTSRYLKTTLQLELFPEAEHVLEKNKQLVRDTILSSLWSLHVKDTLGSEAKDKLRVELLAKVEKVLGKDMVRRIFFQDFVVQ